jgi:hypothetical protein
VRGVCQLDDLTSVVVITNHADEPHHGSGGVMTHQILVIGQRDRLIRQRSTHNERHRGQLY